MRGVALGIVFALLGGATDLPAGTFEPYRNLVVGGEGCRVSELQVTSGHTTFTLSGLTRAVKAGDEVVGFAFSGEGSLAVRVQPGPFLAGNLTSLKERLGAELDDQGRYRDSFKDGVFLVREIPAAVLAAPDPAATGGPFEEVLARHLERVRRSFVGGVDHYLAVSRLNHDPDLLASLEGGAKDGLYSFESNGIGRETLLTWKRDTSQEVDYQLIPVIQQPVRFDSRARPHFAYLQTAFDLELVTRDNRFVEEKTTTTITAATGGVNLVLFQLSSGRSEKDKAWDKRDDPFVVKSVVDASGGALEFSHRYDQLAVRLPRSLASGESVTLTVLAEGNLARSYEGDSFFVFGNMPCFPQVPLEQTHATFHAVVKVKQPWVALGCGVSLKRWQEDGLNCLETREERPVAFPFIVVGDFEVVERKEKSYDLKVYSYVMAKEKSAARLARNGLAVLDYYSSGMEPFPYRELEVVEIPYYRHFFWQSPAGVVEITSEGFNPLGGDSSDVDSWLRRVASRGQNSRYAHEIAHQWFGNLVGMQTDNDNWLSESFAEYLSYMFITEVAKDKVKAKQEFSDWEIATRECSDKGTIYGALALGGARAHAWCYTGLLYGKGPYVLHALREEIGDESFKKVLYFLTVQAAKKQLKATTEDLVQFVNAVTQKDYHDWFNRYVYGTEVPKAKGA